METISMAQDKKQPWKAFASQFGKREIGLITYDAPKGDELRLNGTTGEMSMDILYDTENPKRKQKSGAVYEDDCMLIIGQRNRYYKSHPSQEVTVQIKGGFLAMFFGKGTRSIKQI